jgi:hypothetical protein
VVDCRHRTIECDRDGVVAHSYHANPYDYSMMVLQSLLLLPEFVLQLLIENEDKYVRFT